MAFLLLGGVWELRPRVAAGDGVLLTGAAGVKKEDVSLLWRFRVTTKAYR